MQKIQTIAVLYGGKSTEHEVSVHSAATVCRILQKKYTIIPILIDKDGQWFLQQNCCEKTTQDIPVTPVITAQGSLFVPSKNEYLRPDVFFPVLHGVNGEDGTVQGLLECLNIAYVGCTVLASAMAMDKEISKIAAIQAGVPTLPYQKLSRGVPYDKKALEKWTLSVGYPVFVKPVRLGSSVGVTKVKSAEQLQEAIAFAFRFDTDILVEKGIENPQEIFCGLLGDGVEVHSSECGELKSLTSEFFDYQAKYITVGGCETRVPAVLPQTTREKIRRDSEAIFRMLRGSGLARADFLVDQQGKAWFSEINTIPGMSETSLYPQLFEASGLPYEQVLEKLLDIACCVHKRKQDLSTERV